MAPRLERTKKSTAPAIRESDGLGSIQASRLAALTGLAAKDVVSRPVSDLVKTLPGGIDPALLLYRQICGRVVRTDPVSGADWGVPGATVRVWDTDFNVFGYFPSGWPYGWFLPWGWRRELLATTTTDACGNFCVLVPRFDIDWILRWRLERRCYYDLFRRPTIGDTVERLHEITIPKPPIGPPGPGPDPAELLRASLHAPQLLEPVVAAKVARPLAAGATATLGEVADTAALLEPAFPRPMPAPALESLRSSLAQHLDLAGGDERARLADLNKASDAAFVGAWYGPFFPCWDVVVPEFGPILDIPDITFSVTQDVDGDGTEEEIYSEGVFDVRWDAGTLPPVTLHAKPFAFATQSCSTGPDLPCAAPDLVVVGNMPLKNATGAGVFPIIDTATGYAVRPNRPHPSGRGDEVVPATTLASAPLEGTLDFWGCAHHTTDGQTASHYRIQHRISGDGGATFGPWLPIFDSWDNFRTIGNPPHLDWMHVSQSTDGWWPVLDPNDQWIPGDHHLLQWHGAPNGLIEMRLELGSQSGGAISLIGQASPVRVRIDNSGVSVRMILQEWRPVGQASWNAIAQSCPTIRRAGQDVELKFSVQAWGAHLRSVALGMYGCGGGSPSLTKGLEDLETGVPAGTVRSDYWHKGPADNSLSDEVIFRVDHTASNGAYTAWAQVYSRAFSPEDGHVFDPPQPDLSYNPAPIWNPTSVAIAIVD